MSTSITYDDALRIARTLMDAGHCDIETAIGNPAIPQEYRADIRNDLERERVITIRDPNMVEDHERRHTPWLHAVDRQSWYYWPRLRAFLIDQKGWPEPTVRSVDDTTDRILGAMENPLQPGEFFTRGLVVGYVQSGKTANYSALIAKAADTGYRLIVVLTGVHNSLRLQTQKRLTSELVGVINGRPIGVGWPEQNREWHTFTAPSIEGDFDPGNASAAALAGPNPILIVAKKNSFVLNRIINWLDTAHEETRRSVPCLVIDDEADQASVNTGGNRPFEDGEDFELADLPEVEPPSRINDLIRGMLKRFSKVAYVGYTATPFANVLIDHEAVDAISGNDLYPRDFIVALPRPHGYYGARDIFGRPEDDTDGLNVIRLVADGDVHLLVPARRSDVNTFHPSLPESLDRAFMDFILAGAARAQRGDGAEPATMLIHTSYLVPVQRRLAELVRERIGRIRDEWRYFRGDGMAVRLRRRWEEDFRPVTRAANRELDVPFQDIEARVGEFLEQLTVVELNSDSEDELDYDRDPSLKAVVIGGNRLSRGLTLEGLLTSYYVRRARNYDTLMQMGRWFGFRNGYADLTRIHTTSELAQWFRDLATVEEELRDEIARYERERLTPLDLGVKIRQHPSMLVTSPLKMRAASTIHISFAGGFVQTITFPLHDRNWLRDNIEVTRGFLSTLGHPTDHDGAGRPLWRPVAGTTILDFLAQYKMDPNATQVKAEPLRDFIRRQIEQDELTDWLVGVMGLSERDERLGTIDLGIVGEPIINLIERTRLRDSNSLKAITSRRDQEIGLTQEQKAEAKSMEPQVPYLKALRSVRDRREGVLLIYPISRYSGIGRTLGDKREPLFSDPEQGEDVIGIALIFPESDTAATVEYVVGTVGAGTQW
ncbi:Z1 domain-containing protein [Desulforudis sp. 1088]|uniref:Z1 domain-containing protein n=1 Tax=unclassified Candidatus Desulforudis TaxID=2635950 RepID=UPI003CE4733F